MTAQHVNVDFKRAQKREAALKGRKDKTLCERARHWSHNDFISVMDYTQCCGQTFPEFEAEIWEN